MRRILIPCFVAVLCLPACGGKGHSRKSTSPGVGRLTLAAGPGNPASSAIPSDAQDLTALQIRLAADPTEEIRLDGVTVSASGTGDDSADVAGVEIWIDSDGDGLVGGGDAPLAGPLPYPEDDGSITFPIGSTIVGAGASVDLLVVYDFRSPGAAPLGATFEAALLDTDVMATGVTSGGAVTITGAPLVTGGPFTISVVGLRIRLGHGDGAIPSSTTIGPGDRERPMMQFNLAASGADADLKGITFHAAGSGLDDSDITQVRIYLDMNGDGAIDPLLDLQMGSGPKFSYDDGETLIPLSYTLPAGASYDFIVTYNFKSPLPSGAGSDFQARITGGAMVTTGSSLVTYGSAAGKYVSVFN